MEAINEEIIKKEEHHKYFGIELNKFVWSLLGKSSRTAEENEMMIHAVHASYFHWEKSGKCKPANLQRGEWLISRVYSVLNVPERALYYAARCMDITENYKSEMEDFDLAYADEAMARALACSGRGEEAKKYLASAKEKGNKIAEAEAKQFFTGDLTAEPWYGL